MQLYACVESKIPSTLLYTLDYEYSIFTRTGLVAPLTALSTEAQTRMCAADYIHADVTSSASFSWQVKWKREPHALLGCETLPPLFRGRAVQDVLHTIIDKTIVQQEIA